MIDLPPDVLQHLAQWLPQHDLLHLAYTNSFFYHLLQPHLYHVIIVDSSRTLFDDIFANSPLDWFVYREYPCEPTVIRTLYSLTRFFKFLIQNPHLGKYVRRFVVEENFPDMPQFESNQYLLQVLPCLTNIEVFQWSCAHVQIDANLVSLIPHNTGLQCLSGNFNFTNFLFPPVSFANLQHLCISNFITDKVLNTIDISNFPSIRSLSISKNSNIHKSSFTCSLENCCRSSLNNRVELLRLPEKPAFILSLFNHKLDSRLNLSSLTLKDISLSAADAICLGNNIDLSVLENLSLDNCTECFFETYSHPTVNASRRRTPPANLFLDILASELTSLRLLNLNLSNELCFNRSTFNTLSNLHGLEKLSIHIKMFKIEEQVNLAPLINSLQRHASTLKYLNICCDIVEASSVSVCLKKNFKYSLKSVMGLSMLKELRVLKLPIEYSKIADLPDALTSLRNLIVLQLGIAYMDCVPSKATCFDCSVNGFVLGNANSLINEGYFECSTLLSAKIEMSKGQQYQDLSKKFKNAFENLKFIRFDLKNESLLYDVTIKGNISAENSSIERFDMIIKMFA